MAGDADDAAERRQRIAGEGAVVGFRDRFSDRHAAGRGVLDDDGADVALQHGGGAHGRVEVEQIVVGEFFAGQLRHGEVGQRRKVNAGVLMGIFAVAQFLLAHERQRHGIFTAFFAHLAAQPGADGRVVAGGGVEGAKRQAAARCWRHVALGLELFENGRVIGRIGHDRYVAVVLGGRADQRHAADVDVFDQRVEGGAGAGRLFERIKIGRHHVDAVDAMIFHVLDVGGQIAAGQDAAENKRMKSLHPAAEDVRKLGDVGNFDDGNARVAEHLRRARARQNLPAQSHESLAEFKRSRLVGHRNKRSAFHVQTSYEIRLM